MNPHQKSGKRIASPYAPYILVVDDDSQIRSLFRRILEEAGYFVCEARTAREALALLSDRYFELMVTDLSLPDRDGLDLARDAVGVAPYLKILAASAFSGAVPSAAERNAGVNASVPKVGSPQTLLRVVCNLLAEGPDSR